MKIFGLSISKATPTRKPGEAPANPVARYKGSARHTVEYSNYIAAEMALQHPVVFRCLHKLASSVQTVRWYAEQDMDVPQSERASAGAIKVLNNVLRSPNDVMVASQLRYWMAMNFAVYGRIPFKVGVGVEQHPNAIYPLEARYVSRVSDGRNGIAAYEYGSSPKQSYKTRRAAEASKSNDGYAYEIYTPNIAASITEGCNVNALGAIGLPSAVIRLLLQRAAETASGHPNTKYIIAAEKTLTNKQKEALIETLENSATGEEESGSTLFLYNTKIDVHKLDNDLSDIHSKMPIDDMSRMIAGAFGIPISLLGLGAADGAKFAGNYLESRQSFWQDTIIPNYLTPIGDGLTAAICPPGAKISFDLDSIEAIKDARVTRAKTLTDVNFLTTTEKRELIGYEPSTVLPEVIEPKPSAGTKTSQEQKP